MSREIMQQAFDALTNHRQQTTFQFCETNAAIKALEQELAKPEPIIVPFPSFMRKRVEQAIDNSINSKGMSTHDSKAKVLISDLKLMLLIADLAAKQLDKPTLPMSPEHLQQYIATNNIKPTLKGGGGAGGELAKPEQSYDHASDAQSILHDVNADLIQDAKPEPTPRQLQRLRQEAWKNIKQEEYKFDPEVCFAMGFDAGYGAVASTVEPSQDECGGFDSRPAPLAQPEPVQVRPHEFIAIASKQANMVGTPVVWAEYPTPHKIILDEGWEWGLEARTKKAEVAKPEQIITPISPDQYERFCGKCGACLGKPWVGLTDEEIKEVLDLNVAPWSLSGVALQHVMDDARALEAKLKEKNNAV